ncbi:peptidase family M48-domain-containing protein [Lasiosphaeris hirsuta]|uniref:Peptidase family M48-domain-containing protein n=1 Tax=Lasiosphaeris hirsuta TaxID=260670 RepID=A0AA40APN7_9PEZI|nr:peptidase family M48-domain-containing protein [Lasiosphaeris hirsuta]
MFKVLSRGPAFARLWGAARSTTRVAPLCSITTTTRSQRYLSQTPSLLTSSIPIRALSRPPPSGLLRRGQRRHYQGYDRYGRPLHDVKPLITADGFKRVARSPGTHAVVVLAFGGACIFYFANLETVPVSGRTRFNVYGAEAVREAGEMQYKAILYQLEQQGGRILPEWDWRTTRVRKVMEKLIPFSGMAGEDWEIYVIDDPKTANAFVLPGGKVFVFSGILPMARSDSALAAVLGHEIAHNVADHVSERMSQAIGTNILLYSLMALTGFIGFGPLLMHYFGSRLLDITFGNPMSRLQESEADYIGLMMMAEACYDPAEAVKFWAYMESAKVADVPEWLSTHPSNENRIKKIQEWLPEAIDRRKQSDCHTTTAFADLFKRALSRGVIIVG